MVDVQIINEIKELKQLIVKIINIIPEYYTIKQVSQMCKVSTEAIRKRLQNHFEFERDYFFKNGKIIITREAFVRLKEHYNG